MKKTFLPILIFVMPLLSVAQSDTNDGKLVDYKIITGRFEGGSAEQQGAYAQLFGADDTQRKFDLYFHWYNIAHEYSHCLLDFYGKSVGGVEEEMLANKFAVAYWQAAGFADELSALKSILDGALSAFPNPVPEGKTFTDWYTEIWGTEQLMNAAVYGYFQFKSVLIAMDDADDLTQWFANVGIDGFSMPSSCKSKKYPVEAEAAADVLNDLQLFFKASGLEQPTVGLDLTNDPMTHRSQKIKE